MGPGASGQAGAVWSRRRRRVVVCAACAGATPLVLAVVDVAAAFGGRSLDVRERDPVLRCTRYLEK